MYQRSLGLGGQLGTRLESESDSKAMPKSQKALPDALLTNERLQGDDGSDGVRRWVPAPLPARVLACSIAGGE